MSEQKNFKETLNLPKTDFPIRAGLATREPELLKEFELADLYHKLLAKNMKKKFVLHDGPPYPNGDIHLGHALNKTLKDIVLKYRAMNGYATPFIPGWDCHGLPIETQLLKDLKKNKQPIPEKAEFREKCKDYALGYVATQKEQFKRLGILADWDNPYLTLQPAYEAEVIAVFKELALNGYVYKGNKPIHWCPECQTALAEAEIEYEDHKSPSIYMKFRIDGVQKTRKAFYEIDKKDLTPLFPKGQEASLIVWTTTPWTMPANVAIAVNPAFDYVVIKATSTGELFVLAESLVAKVMTELEIEYTVIGQLKGADLEGVVCRHPYLDRESPVVCAEYVTAEDGTGCVHIAPGHGQDDHVVGKKYDLPVLMPVDEKGVFTKEAGQFAGMKTDDANKPIVELMQSLGTLLKLKFVKHSYPHCWRCKSPVIFRATPQWFVAMDKQGKNGTIREASLKGIDATTWYPGWGRNRLYAMIEGRPDWCISRQRSWGIPIPIMYCESCGEPQFTLDMFEAIIETVRAEGTNAWFTKTAAQIVPAGYKCSSCSATTFRKESDIMDVWMESGASQAAVLKTNPNLAWPADLYLEGSDQHRGWFHSSMLMSAGENGVAPYKSVLTHGFTIDDKGRKMSKSLGNVVDAIKTIDQMGADVLRLWVSSVDFKNDLAVSPSILKQVQDSFSKIRNTWRFMISNLYDYEEMKDLLPLDRWILSQFQHLVADVRQAYAEYEFHTIYHKMHDFCANDLSALYLDMQKDNLYTNRPDSKERRSCQHALRLMLVGMVKLMAPIMTFTCEDIYKHIKLFVKSETAAFALLTDMPEVDETLVNVELEQKYAEIIKLKDEVYKVLEQRRAEKVISASVEALVTITDTAANLARFDKKALEVFFIVSQIKFVEGAAFAVTVEKAKGDKCIRCWKFFEELNAEHVCVRCAEAVK